MLIHFVNIILLTLLIPAAVAGLIWLQIFLSRRPNRWLGLILPALSFVLSWLFVFGLMDTGDTWQNILLITVTLLLSNIPTIILLIIYAVIREKLRRKAQLDKMNIQDLS
jgi:hypothetical protein